MQFRSSYNGQMPMGGSWNCYTPYQVEHQLFLAQKINKSTMKERNKTLKRNKTQSDIHQNTKPKTSLRNKRQKQRLDTSAELSSRHYTHLYKNNSSFFIQESYTNGLLCPSDQLTKQPYSPQPRRIIYHTNNPQIQVLNAKPIPLQPPPQITFSHALKEDDSKHAKHQLRKDLKKDSLICSLFNTETTMNVSGDSLKNSHEIQEHLSSNNCTYSQQIQLKESLQNPQPEHMNKSQSTKRQLFEKTQTTKSLMNSHQLNFNQEKEDARSFCSEKNPGERRIQRMSEVEEIKSQADSEEGDSSDEQSIVVGRLDTSTYSIFNRKDIGLMIPISINPVNSSIQFGQNI